MLALILLTRLLQQSPSDSGPLHRDTSAVRTCASLPDFRRQHQQGLKLLQQGSPAAAVRILKRSLELCPEEAESSRDLANAELAAGDPGSAETLVKTLLTKQNTAELHNLLGAIEAAESEPKAAASEYQIAATMQPNEQNIFDFGTSLMKLDFRAAGSVLGYGTKQFPTSVKLTVAYGLALYAQDRVQEGAEALCKAAELDPTDVHPMEVLADTETIPRALLPTVVMHLSELSRQHPEDGLLLFDLTMARSGRWSGDQPASTHALIADLQRALELNPHLPKAYVALAAAYDEQKRYPEEIAALRHASALAPDQAKTHYLLAFAYRKSGDQQRFHEELQRYQALHAE